LPFGNGTAAPFVRGRFFSKKFCFLVLNFKKIKKSRYKNQKSADILDYEKV